MYEDCLAERVHSTSDISEKKILTIYALCPIGRIFENNIEDDLTLASMG